MLGRVAFGLMIMMAHGWGKVSGNIDPIKNVVAEHNLPFPLVLAWMAALAEFVGGGLIALGLATRLAASFVAFTMLVAAFIIHGADPFKVRELAFVYLTLSLIYLFKGAGRWSLDAVLRK